MYSGLKHSPDFSLRQSQLVIGLQSRPDFRGNSEKTAKPQSRIGGDRPTPVHDLTDAARRHVYFPRNLINAQVERLDEILKQNFLRMDGLQQPFRDGIFSFFIRQVPLYSAPTPINEKGETKDGITCFPCSYLNNAI
jgi:hypothetical protein